MRLRLMVLAGLTFACGGSGPAVMEFVEVLPAQPKLGEVATVRFKLLDSRGIPLAGQNVEFRLQSNNSGVSIEPKTALSIRGSGFAETQLVANDRVNSVIVVATAGGREVSSPPITFAGTVPSGRQFTFQCGPIAGAGSGGRHAIGAYDASRTLIAGSAIDCTAHVADRNGDGVTDALVSFLTEAGSIGPSEVSKANLVGDATVLYKTSLPLPQDVGPETFTWTPRGSAADPSVDYTGEYLAPLWMQPYNWVEDPLTLGLARQTTYTLREPRRPDPIRLKPDGTGRYENNPRDNLVSLVAFTSGEEGFSDSNNNGHYDLGEPFDDLTEPFVDSNDNGTCDLNERFIDLDNNGRWTGKNGDWDGNTLIWKQERILWTGIPAEEDTRTSVPGVTGHKPVFSRTRSAAPLALTCPGTGSDCTAAGPPQTVTAYLADPWFNALARNGEGDSCAIDASERSPIAASGASSAGFAFTYPAGELLDFTVSDNRNPQAAPADQIPRRVPAISFQVTISCTYTSSPNNPYIVKITAGSISGTIE